MSRFAAPGVSTAAALVWAVLAWRTPTSTFHFAPLIVAAAWPVVARSYGERHDRPQAGMVAASAAGLAMVTGLVLLAAGRLEGPTFWSDGGAIVEVALAAVLGGAYGFRVLTRERRGLLA